MLEVRFIEISRTAGRELGVQWNRFGDNSIINVGNRVSANNLPVTAASIAGEARRVSFRTRRRSASLLAVLSRATPQLT
jgi:Flp pilus assembly secretin CpaC